MDEQLLAHFTKYSDKFWEIFEVSLSMVKNYKGTLIVEFIVKVIKITFDLINEG